MPNRPYQSVVIVAHSQGTVITVDLLRYLCLPPEASLAELGKVIPVKLLTMGSPLRQLLPDFAFLTSTRGRDIWIPPQARLFHRLTFRPPGSPIRRCSTPGRG